MGATEIVVSLLTVIAAVAPGALALVAGTETDEEAIAKMTAIVDKMPRRTGDGGAWDADLARRKGEGE